MAQFAAFALLFFGTITFTTEPQLLVRDYPGLDLAYAVLDVLGRATFTTFLFVFPDGHTVPRWTRWVALAWIAIQVPVPFVWLDPVKPLTPLIEQLTFPAFFVGLATAAASQVYRYRRVSTPAQRRQTKWTVFGFTVG